VYLKTLEIQGFKSFPEKTIIEFHKGITAIVGPNGSGKSNVTDAIRWVLGEQSIKTLRGSRMQDIIFTGTQSRRAMGYAEVTMVIDNSDGKMDIQYSEIAVTRRLYRSGESEYFLNKTSCRLKDILSVFMDTGLGRDGYSIVGQGRVDEILSNKSEDRRKVFEEASGIVKYKTRKEESERKLNNTRQNLLRINDIIAEIENQIGPLKKQSETAKQYLLYRDELKSIEVALFLENIDKYSEKLKEYSQEFDSLSFQIEENNFNLEKIKSQNRKFTDKIKELDEEIEQKKLMLQNYSDSIKDKKSKIEMNLNKIEQHNIKITAIDSESDSVSERILKIEEELKTKKEKEVYLNKQLLQFKEELLSYENQMKQVISALDEKYKRAESLKFRSDELTESLYDKRSQSRQTRAQNEMITGRNTSIDNEIASLISEKDSLSIQKEECEENFQEINNKEKLLKDEIDKIKIELDNLKKDCTKSSVKIETDKLDIENINYRIKTLTELEESMSGFSDAVKAIIKKNKDDKSFFPGIRGTVADLIYVDKKFETAIETALGQSIQNVITDTERTASDIINHLKHNRMGRATFLPITSVAPRHLEKNISDKVRFMKGFIGIGKEVVEYPEDIDNIVSSLLGRIVIVDIMDNAISIARQFGFSFRIVTLDGDVVNPGGSMTGGFQKSKGTGILGRSREIEDLTNKIKEIRQSVAIDSEKLTQKEELLVEKARELQIREQKHTNISHEKIREESRLASMNQDITRCSSRINMLKAEKSQLEKQMNEIDNEADLFEKEALEIENQISILKDEIEKIQTENTIEQESRDELRELISDLKLSVNSIEESLNSAREMTERIENEKQAYIGREEKSKDDQQKSFAEIELLEKENLSILEDINKLSVEKEELTLQTDQLSSSRKDIDSQMSDFYEKFGEISEKIGVLQTEIGKSEVKKGRMETALDDVKNKLWEQYELTYDNAQKWRTDISNLTAALKQVNDLKNQIKELGDINVNSIEEYEKVSERYEFLVNQRDDIEISSQKLIKLITDITDEMKKQFMSHFEIINENFKEVFSELFGGGMAEIALGSEDDVLNCNIDIHAQPPGKKLQNMLLLSGGERCLTAIALLFAILKLRPSPFCVLDEIEAALDDTNIVRFSEYVRNYSDESQFILVTHRKGTMEAADMLYGVTMQERGISKVLSMKLD